MFGRGSTYRPCGLPGLRQELSLPSGAFLALWSSPSLLVETPGSWKSYLSPGGEQQRCRSANHNPLNQSGLLLGWGRVISKYRDKGRKEGGRCGSILPLCAVGHLCPQSVGDCHKLAGVKNGTVWTAGRFAFGKRTKARNCAQWKELGDRWGSSSLWIQISLRRNLDPFGLGGSPSGSWHCLQSNFCLVMGRVYFFPSCVLQNILCAAPPRAASPWEWAARVGQVLQAHHHPSCKAPRSSADAIRARLHRLHRAARLWPAAGTHTYHLLKRVALGQWEPARLQGLGECAHPPWRALSHWLTVTGCERPVPLPLSRTISGTHFTLQSSLWDQARLDPQARIFAEFFPHPCLLPSSLTSLLRALPA